MNTTTTFDIMLDPTPTPVASEVAAKASEYWGLLVAFVVGLGTMYGVYRRYCRGKLEKFRTWKTAFIALPVTLADIKAELVFAPNMSIKEKLSFIAGDIESLGHILSNEIGNRRSALQFATTPLFEFDINGKLVWANDALLEMTENDVDEVVGGNWVNMIADKYRAVVITGWARAVQNGTNYRARFPVALENGEIWVVCNIACNKDHKGVVVGWLGKLREIKVGERPHLPE